MKTSTLRRDAAASCALCFLLMLSACSKANTVTVNDAPDAGEPGTKGAGDECAATAECQPELACLFSRCRPSCGADAECEGASLCWSDGTTSGCALSTELACGDVAACGSPLLACGLDDKCRIACSASRPCPRSDQACIAGACVSTTEAGYATSFGTCDPAEQGQFSCDGATLSACNVDEPGKTVLGTCATAELCEQGAAAKASACPACGVGGQTARCKGTNAETCNQDQSGFDQTDCAAGPARQCNPTTGACIALDIDAHEVTRGEYAAATATLAAGTGACAYKTAASAYEPDAACMAGATVCQGASCDEQPQVCVDWCDAEAYCASKGRRLCGRINGGMAAKDRFDDPGTSQWMNACSSGGQGALTFGAWAGPSSGQACNGALKGVGTTVPPGALMTCQSPISTYASLYDLTGNVAEWEDSCDKTASAGSATDSCRVRGGSFESTSQVDLGCAADRALPRNSFAPDVGFRCCGP